MFRPITNPALVHLRAILAVLPFVAITVAGAASSHLHLAFPAGSNWC